MITDIIVVLIFLIFAMLGFARGFVKSAALMVRVSVSVIIAFLLSRPIATFLNNLFGLSGLLSKAFGTDAQTGGFILIAIITVILFIIIRMILHLLVKFAEKSREKSKTFNTLDRLLGALLGILRFAFIFSLLSIVFYIATRLSFLKSFEVTVFENSKIAKWLYDIVINIILAEAIAAAARALGR